MLGGAGLFSQEKSGPCWGQWVVSVCTYSGQQGCWARNPNAHKRNDTHVTHTHTHSLYMPCTLYMPVTHTCCKHTHILHACIRRSLRGAGTWEVLSGPPLSKGPPGQGSSRASFPLIPWSRSCNMALPLGFWRQPSQRGWKELAGTASAPSQNW